jgi:hypothetical protein
VWNSQPYAAPSGPPPAQWPHQQQEQYPTSGWDQNSAERKQPLVSDANTKEGQRFKPKKKLNDLPFLIFYILTVRICMTSSISR